MKSFSQRIRETKPTRWVRFGLVSLIFLLWVAWLGSWWVAVFLLLLFDIYITGYIPLSWWKSSKNPVVKGVMSWVDAIIYALILVYFVFTFIGQNYQIPSSSLEKTLLVGDYLWVNKMSYGPRVPTTPVHFPLVQNTFPILNTKSYLEHPQWDYHRLKGLGDVQRGDIVVFNFPAGDTVALKMQNPDYYTLVRMFGRFVVNNNPDQFGEIIYRPVDRRENYVKRAVGLPGERLRISDGVIYINGEPIPQPEDVQFNYYYQALSRPVSDSEWEEFGIAADDRGRIDVRPSDRETLLSLGFAVGQPGDPIPPIYLSPLTSEMVAKLRSNPNIGRIMRVPAPYGEYLFPEGLADSWTRSDYGEILIPRKGMTVRMSREAWLLYNRIIRNYENHPDSWIADDGTVYIDGKKADTYTFAMDYYFMMGDNRDNSLDSRYWGFVPEDHIVGKPMRVLVSFDKDKSIFNGGIRWNRVFKDANSGLPSE